MKRWIALLLTLLPVVAHGQWFGGGQNQNWRIVNIGPLANRPASCARGQVWICVGAGCTDGNNVHYCQSANTWQVQGVAAGSGITSLNGLNPAAQTFVDDTNVTVVSAGSTHTLTWAGALAKVRQHAATVYNDAANTWSTGAQSFAAATSLLVPSSAGYAPTASASVGYNSTTHRYVAGANAAGKVLAYTTDLTDFSVNGGFHTLAVTPSSDAIAGVFRRNTAGQTSYIVEFQTEGNALLSGIYRDGTFRGTGFSFGANASMQSATVTSAADGVVMAIRRLNASQASRPFEIQTEANAFLGGFDRNGAVNLNGVTDGCATWASGVLGSTGTACGSGGGGAPTTAPYWMSTADSGTSAEVNLGALSTGLLKITVSGGTATPSTAAVADVTGMFSGTGDYLRSDGTRGTPTGAGDVSGPASATDNAVARFDGTGGKTIQNSTCAISDTGQMTCPGGYASGDGTSASMVLLPELTANGTNDFRIVGATDQSADGCIVVSGQPADDNILKATATTVTIDGKTCRVMAWEPDVSGGAPAWGAITGTLADQTDLNTALGLKAPLASPTFTGTPAAPTATQGNNSTQVATTAYVDTGLSAKAASNASTTVNGQTCALGGSCTISASSLPITIPFLTHTAAGLTWTNLPAVSTEFTASALYRVAFDLTGSTQCRIVQLLGVAGVSGSTLTLEYSTDSGGSWATTGVSASIPTGIGTNAGAWQNVVAGAKADVWLRFTGAGGDGVADPNWRYLVAQCK